MIGLRRVTALLLAGGAAGCSDPHPAPPPAGFDLLSRSPDTVLDQPGTLVPGEEARFGVHEISGWENRADGEGPDGQPLPGTDGRPGLGVWSASRTARLRLLAAPPVDRTLELSLWTAPPRDGEAPTNLTIELNGTVLGEEEIGAELETVAVLAPRAVWRHGENVLALTVDRKHRAGSAWRGLALARVHYGETLPVEVDLDGRRLVLSGETGVNYFLEQRGPGHLRIEGRPEGDGALEVELARMEPRTGELTPLGEPILLEPEEGRLSHRVPLPAPTGAVLQCRLVWTERGSGPTRLAIERLSLEERDPLPRPPIVFISVDTLAARNMSLYGYWRETTPRLEEWARECVVFENAKANAPWTIPSYLSQMTGTLPRSHRFEPKRKPKHQRRDAQRPNIWELYQLTPNRWTMAEMIRSAGYRTAAFVDNLWLTRVPGFSQGFDVYDDHATRFSIEDTEGGMRTVFPRALEWVRGLRPGEPFFLFVQILDCHGPYLPVEPFRGRFAGAEDERDLEAPVAYTSPPTFGTIPDYVARSLVPEDEELPLTMRAAPLIAAYDEKILEVDDYVGGFLEALRALPFYDEAFIVFSADHGESMVEHDYFFRHGTVYEETVNVPLVVKLPHGERGGTRVEDAVQLVDLYATFADVVGIPAGRPWLHGRSLLDLLEGRRRGPPEPVVVHGNMMDQTSIELDGWKLVRFHPHDCNIRTLLTHDVFEEYVEHVRRKVGAPGDGPPFEPTFHFFDREKSEKLEDALSDQTDVIKGFYHRRGSYFELYDLRSDPGETRNVADEHPEKVAELLALMERADRRSEEARDAAAFSTVVVPMSADAREELKKLGYLDD